MIHHNALIKHGTKNSELARCDKHGHCMCPTLGGRRGLWLGCGSAERACAADEGRRSRPTPSDPGARRQPCAHCGGATNSSSASVLSRMVITCCRKGTSSASCSWHSTSISRSFE